MDEEEQNIRRKQEEEREALRQKMLEEQRLKEEEKLRQEQELIQKRQQFVEQTKSKLMFAEMPEEKPKKKAKKYAEDDGFVTDGSSDGENRERIKRPLNEGLNLFYFFSGNFY
jgi:RNA polymerase-associated protein CTR9